MAELPIKRVSDYCQHVFRFPSRLMDNDSLFNLNLSPNHFLIL